MNPRVFLPVLVLTATALVPLVGCGSDVSRENYEKIQTGMTLEEVEAILGPGERTAGAGGAFGDIGGSAQVYQWVEGEKTITVAFVNGEVISKLQEGL